MIWWYTTLKIFCPNSTSFVRYKNNKFQARKLSRWFVRNLLFLYLTNEVEFVQNILQSCLSSYHLHVWFFLVNLDAFFVVVCTGFHEVVVFIRYVPQFPEAQRRKEEFDLTCFALWPNCKRRIICAFGLAIKKCFFCSNSTD